MYFDPNPERPKNLSLSGSTGQHPRLDWNANTEPDIDKYKIYRKKDGVDTYFKYLSYVNHPTISYTDNGVTIGPGGNYVRYKIKAVDTQAKVSQFSNEAQSKYQVPPKASKSLTNEGLPKDFDLKFNYPNPFNPVTTIKYGLPENSYVTLKVYNLMGQEVRTLVTGNMEAGYQNVIWYGKDSHGNPVSSGMYMYRLNAISRESAKEFHMTRKMALLR